MATILITLVPLTYCPGCYGTGIRDGIVTVSSPEATVELARANPCIYCDADGREWKKITWLKRWTLKPVKP